MDLIDSPLYVFIFSFLVLLLSAEVGHFVRKRVRPLKEEERDDFGVVLGATLTLLGLIIGFTFSMAVSRYDKRKDYEEAEANAIGTEYVRADLLSSESARKVRELLKKYTDQRILFFTTRNQQSLAKIGADTAELQNQLWAAVRQEAVVHPTPVVTLTVAGMNEVLNSEGRTQAAWWNRIPGEAWLLMAAIAVSCNFLVGYGSRYANRRLALILPIAVSIAFFLISDIDSPSRGAIRVVPQNLVRLSQSLRTQ